jgi:ATP synthase protein I
MNDPPKEEPFVREVRRQAERAREARQLGFWEGLGLLGAIGWMVSLPAVLGAFLGRGLDRWFSSGIAWTLGLLGLGLTLGCATAYRHVKRELKQ